MYYKPTYKISLYKYNNNDNRVKDQKFFTFTVILSKVARLPSYTFILVS